MIKFLLSVGDDRKVVGIGITKENVEALVAGRPIVIKGKDVETPGLDITLFYGETIDDCIEYMDKEGIHVSDTTRVNKCCDDPLHNHKLP